MALCLVKLRDNFTLTVTVQYSKLPPLREGDWHTMCKSTRYRVEGRGFVHLRSSEPLSNLI